MSLPNDSWRALLWHKLKSRKICIVTGILICHGLFLQWLDFVFYSEVHMSTLASWCRLGKQKDNSRAVKALGKEVEWGESVRDVCGTCGHTAAPKKQTLMVVLLYWVSCWAAGTKNSFGGIWLSVLICPPRMCDRRHLSTCLSYCNTGQKAKLRHAEFASISSVTFLFSDICARAHQLSAGSGAGCWGADMKGVMPKIKSVRKRYSCCLGFSWKTAIIQM